MTFSINRRTAMLAAVGTAGAMTLPKSSIASEEMKPKLPMAKARGYKVGSLEVVALLAGSAPRDNPHGIFGLNASDEEFAKVSEANFIGTDVAQFLFHAVAGAQW
nr:hypothetical protein [uncultured Cohaesibacter sp.]